MRMLTRLRIPVLVFANKIDRLGARYQDLLDSIGQKLTPRPLAMTTVTGPATVVTKASSSPR
ncbi:Elongation factor Tu GTP binding domain [Micromonospora matsumotoense]|uniref:Elongation factor Tu GTP binding domain n=1 Tax=Micromonospora matsumotoense TaxID=121616 RepID=A0A1C5ALL1_9ACTN|nr:Elongation factor Tu GTP binding domain [Micromonospora matsumotoense]